MREIRIPGLRRLLRISRGRQTVARDVDEEIRFHLDARTEELIARGMSPADAWERARQEYGDVDVSRHELAAVDQRRLGQERREELFMSFLDDVRYAARGLVRRPSLLAVTTLTLSVGIAANAVMFGVIDQLLLRPPALVAAPDRVKRLYYGDVSSSGEKDVNPVTTYPALTAMRERTTAFSDIAAFSFASDWSLGAGVDARPVRAQLVSGNYFRLLGVSAQLGRTLADDDDRPPVGERVAVVSDGFWKGELGGGTDAIGRTLLLQGKSFVIVGVAPEGFSGLDRQRLDVWVPISSMGSEIFSAGWHNTPNNWWAQVVARVRDGVAPEVAQAQASGVYRALVREWGDRNMRDTTSSVMLGSVIGTRTPGGVSVESKVSLWLMGVSAVVLLIACANVANLLIARALERRREIAVRIALGVSRARLLQLLLTESLLLTSISAAVALMVARGASRVVQQLLLPNIVWSESVLDGRVLAFVTFVALLCVLLAGLAPVFYALRTRVSEGLKASARQVTSNRGLLRFSLITMQAALSVVLLIGAGLFVRSLHNVVTRDIGVDTDRVLKVEMALRRFGFDTNQVEDVFRRAAERLRRLPGVNRVADVRLSVPMSNANASGFDVPGHTRHQFAGGGPYNSMVSPGFFATVGTTLVRGRDFTDAEARVPTRVAIVNDIIAKAYWPAGDAVGQCVKLGADSSCSEIVGVVKTVVQFHVVGDDRAVVYVPTHHPGFPRARPGALLVRTTDDAARLVPTIRREIQALAPNMPYVQVRPFSDLVALQLQPRRLGATMFVAFGIVALIIAAIGLYSVMAYWVSQRTQEIGVRMALGAERGDVLRLVATQSARPIVVGVLVGALVALAASRFVTDLLYDTSPRDPTVYVAAIGVLALAAAIASVVPARRSTAVDPAIAMRAD